MLRCPKCNRTYENESQKFCTRDGGRLIPVESAGFDPNSTVVAGQPKPFDPNATVVSQPPPQKAQSNAPQEAFDPNKTVVAPPPPPPQPSPDPNATLYSPPPQSSPDPNATLYSPPSPQTPSPQTPPPQPSPKEQNPQLFQTIASVSVPANPPAPPPANPPYDSTESVGQPSYPSTPSQHSYAPQQTPPPSAPQQPQTPQIPMPARYEAGGATSIDLKQPTSPVNQPSSSQGGQTSDDLGFQTNVGYQTEFGYQTDVDYRGAAPTSAQLQPPPGMEDMHTRVLSQTGNYNEAVQTVTPAVVPTKPPVAAPPKKKSKAFLFLGLGAIFLALFLVVGTAGVVIFLKPELIGMGKKEPGNVNNTNNTNGSANQANNNQTGQTNSNNSNTNNTNDNNNTNTNEIPPPPNSAQFVNSETNASGDLANHFAPFSFYYPQNWTKTPSPKGYFVEVIRKLPDGFPQEHFAASYYNSKGTLDADRVDFEKKVQESSAELAKVFPGYKKISEGETKVNGIAGYEFKFSGQIDDAKKGMVNFYGRMVFLPPGKDAEKNGVKLLMYGTSLAPEFQSMDDFGLKGELPVILNSFKLGQ